MRSLCVWFWVMVFVLGGAGCAGAQESPLVGKKAPDFTLERVSGKSVSLNEVIKDKKGNVVKTDYSEVDDFFEGELKEWAAALGNSKLQTPNSKNQTKKNGEKGAAGENLVSVRLLR